MAMLDNQRVNGHNYGKITIFNSKLSVYQRVNSRFSHVEAPTSNGLEQKMFRMNMAKKWRHIPKISRHIHMTHHDSICHIVGCTPMMPKNTYYSLPISNMGYIQLTSN